MGFQKIWPFMVFFKLIVFSPQVSIFPRILNVPKIEFSYSNKLFLLNPQLAGNAKTVFNALHSPTFAEQPLEYAVTERIFVSVVFLCQQKVIV